VQGIGRGGGGAGNLARSWLDAAAVQGIGCGWAGGGRKNGDRLGLVGLIRMGIFLASSLSHTYVVSVLVCLPISRFL
jgi:hypothetical protein